MRSAVLACLVVACSSPPACPAAPPPRAAPTPPAVVAPSVPAPSAAPRAEEHLAYVLGAPRTWDPAIVDLVDPSEAKRVRTALFRKHLSDLGECPRPAHEPGTWTEIDRQQESNFEAGLFVPFVAQRIRGSFTGPGTSELLFVVRIANCQNNTFDHLEVAVFSEPIKKPVLRWSEHPSSYEASKFVAIVQDEGKPPRFLREVVATETFQLVELNRPFVPGAPFRTSASASVGNMDGTPAIEPWSVVSTWKPEPPAECRGFYVTSQSPRTVRFGVTPGPCRVP